MGLQRLLKPSRSTHGAGSIPLFSALQSISIHFLFLPPAIIALLLLSGPVYSHQIDFVTAYKERKMTAFRIPNGRITVDGELTESEWLDAKPAKDFIQKLPATGELASEPTEVRLLYDDLNLYVGVYCFDSAGRDGIVVNDITTDFYTLSSDGFQIVLDTYDDDRNAFLFATNPEAGRFDMQIGADGNAGNTNWDGIWYVNTEITDQGWQVEMAIPFRTLRFQGHARQVWGVNFERRVRRKFEDSYWAPIPPPYRLGRVSLCGSLEGIEGIQQGRNLYIKPYVSTPFLRREDDDVDFQPEIGLEVLKWAVTPQLTLDATINTDFSQVEADDVRTNLTRFSLFFPEKRDFFLENASIFEWGRKKRSIRFRPDLIPFFSRRIGLSDEEGREGAVIPIAGGARLTGRAGKYTLGMLSMQAQEFSEQTPSTNFSVVRMRRDIMARSDVGGIFVNKSAGDGRFNRTYGFDTNFNFFRYLDINSYALKTESPDLAGDDMASNVSASWIDEFWEMRAGHLRIGENFNPEVGFVPRSGMHKTSGEVGITPRPGSKIPWMREFNPQLSVDYITNSENVLETRNVEGRATIEFSESSLLSMARESTFERLTDTFEIRDGIEIEPGDYSFDEYSVFFRSNRSKLLSITGRYGTGTFWNGDRDNYRLGFTLHPSHKLATELQWSHNDVNLPGGDFLVDLLSAKIDYSFSNRVFLNALIQYDSDDGEVFSNIRFNFLYKPLSDFFLVYNERRTPEGEVKDRALIAKLTYVFSF